MERLYPASTAGLHMTANTLIAQQQKPREARLVADEKRLFDWYETLVMEPYASGDGWYSLHELKAATGIPMTRLPTVLARRLWIRETRKGVVWYHGPRTFLHSLESGAPYVGNMSHWNKQK